MGEFVDVECAMRGTRYLLIGLACSLPVAAADIDAILDAERQYAQDVIDHGVRDGFLRHVIEESVVFRPLPTAARTWFEAQEPADFSLSWEPRYAEIAASGDFGYTIGPWTSTPLVEGERPVTQGFYTTVWIKGEDGAWHPLVDHGIGGVTADESGQPITVLGETRSAPIEGSYLLNTRYQGLMAVALRLPLAQADAQASIDRTWLANDLVVLRAGRAPVQGNDAVRQILSRELGATPPALTVMAASGDLGMSLGGEPGRGAYLRLWRHHDANGWQLAVDVATPVAAPEPEAETPPAE
jgi:ketosteroid isomerase-like protein